MDSTALVAQLRQLGLWPDHASAQQAARELSRQFPDARLLRAS